MKKRRLSIKKRLMFSSAGILLILTIIGLTTRFFIEKTMNNYNLLTMVKDISMTELEMRNLEKDFMINETVNPDFFETSRSTYVENFIRHYENVSDDIKKLSSKRLIQKNNLDKSMNELSDLFAEYKGDFLNLEKVILQKGFKDYGLIGQMREIIHQVEEKVKENNDLRGNIYMLMLRRHEKDYLLRRDLKYQNKFNARLQEFKTYLEQGHNASPLATEQLLTALNEYGIIFNKMIARDIYIGLNHKKGLQKDLHESQIKTSEKLDEVHHAVFDISRTEIRNSVLLLFAILISLSVVILLILTRISREIVVSIKKLKTHTAKLGKGELPGKINIKYNNEIAEMMDEIKN